jgi:DNA-binding PadR family transcriptional regulator
MFFNNTIGKMRKKRSFHCTVNERILLHLKDYPYQKEPVQLAVTQKGIGEAVGIMHSHVPRALKKLKLENFITERYCHVENIPRRLKTYFLTEKGIQYTTSLIARIAKAETTIKINDRQKKISIGELYALLKGKISFLKLVLYCSAVKTVDIRKLEVGWKIVDYSSSAPRIPVFVNRSEELDMLRSYVDSKDCKAIIIFGPAGIGKTVLASKLIDIYKVRKSVFWYQLTPDDNAESILEAFAEFTDLMGFDDLSNYLKSGKSNWNAGLQTALTILDGSDTIIVFDGYYDIAEEIVEFLTQFVSYLKHTKGIKMIVTAREAIPFYNWFYTRSLVNEGMVVEMHLKGLDEASGKILLGIQNIKPDAYRQIHQLTGGIPILLKLLKNDDREGLKRKSNLTTEQIRLLQSLKKLTF